MSPEALVLATLLPGANLTIYALTEHRIEHRHDALTVMGNRYRFLLICIVVMSLISYDQIGFIPYTFGLAFVPIAADVRLKTKLPFLLVVSFALYALSCWVVFALSNGLHFAK
jgi:hypothetical protein